MSSQPPSSPVISLADDSPRNPKPPTLEMASLAVGGQGDPDTLSPLDNQPNERYSIVQPGVLLTEPRPELEGNVLREERPYRHGGYADVYKGSWTGPDQKRIEVAVKVLRVTSSVPYGTDRLKRKIDIRMKRETLIWAQAKHLYIHPFIGFRSSPEPQLISPWCAHGNLSDYLVRNQSLSSQDRRRLITQAGLGLEYLHGRKPPICHADIKPENILINNSLEATLSDFGVSKVLESLAEPTGLTTTGGALPGTYPYTAPELFDPELVGKMNSRAEPTCASDVYAFGGLILAVMSGKAPFHQIAHKPSIMMRVLRKNTPNPKDHEEIPENDSLWVVMNGCWRFEPSKRLLMTEVLEKINAVSQSHSSKQPTSPPSEMTAAEQPQGTSDSSPADPSSDST